MSSYIKHFEIIREKLFSSHFRYRKASLAKMNSHSHFLERMISQNISQIYIGGYHLQDNS